MKKIAMILPTLGGGGAERITLNLASKLVQLGNEVHIILVANEISYDLEEDLHIHALSESGRITGQRAFDRILMAMRLRNLINRLERDGAFDLFVSNLLDADQIVSRLSLANAYYVIHNTTSLEISSRSTPRKIGRKTRKVIELYSQKHLICVSDGVSNDLVNAVGVRPASIRTIYNPFDVAAIRRKADPRPDNLPDGEYIIHIGRVHRQKRIDVLLEAFKEVRPECRLVMLAKPSRELEEMIAEAGLTNRVILPGFQTNPYPWIRNARLFVLSSDYEGLPTVIIESLICGTPVVSTDCPSGPSEILTGDLARWLVPTDDPSALAARINEALDTDIDLGGFKVERFSIDNVARQYLELCNSGSTPLIRESVAHA